MRLGNAALQLSTTELEDDGSTLEDQSLQLEVPPQTTSKARGYTTGKTPSSPGGNMIKFLIQGAANEAASPLMGKRFVSSTKENAPSPVQFIITS